jgi:hypothetical protein
LNRLVALAFGVALVSSAGHASGRGEKEVQPESLTVEPAAAPGQAPPLSESDVVRMLAAGESEDAILRVLHERPVSFDLSDEMLVELKRAGVSERLLTAMTARQIEMQAKPPLTIDEVIAEAAPGHAVVTIAFEPGDGDAALYLPTVAGKDLAERLQLQALPEDRRISDLALFVACRTKAHVPGLWRSSSPLGRDFVSMPPHQILAFESGARRVAREEVPEGIRAAHPAEAPPEWLRFDVPREIQAQVATASTHDLLVGIAALVGDHYLALALEKANEVSASSALRIPAAVRDGGGHGQPFEIRVDPPPEAKAHKAAPRQTGERR